MFSDTSSYIRTNVTIYIVEAVALTSSLEINPQLYPIVNNLLSSTFMKMIGAVEQKILHIKWFLAFSDFNSRFEIAKNLSRHSISINELNDTYSKFMEKLKELDGSGHMFNQSSIWSNEKFCEDAYKAMINLFDNSNIIHYTNRQYLIFKNHNPFQPTFECKKLYEAREALDKGKKKEKADLTTKMKNIIANYNALNSTIKLKENGSNATVITNFIEQCYERAIIHRHTLAHNLDAEKNNMPHIKSLNSNEQYFNTYYYHLLMIIYLDFIFQEFFEYFIKVKNKTLF